jgi:hypothetical protein
MLAKLKKLKIELTKLKTKWSDYFDSIFQKCTLNYKEIAPNQE